MKCIHCGKFINGEFSIYLKKPIEEVEGPITENDIEFLHKDCEEEFYENKEHDEIFNILQERIINDDNHCSEKEMDDFITTLIERKEEIERVKSDVDDFIDEIKEMSLEDVTNLLKKYGVKFKESEDNE